MKCILNTNNDVYLYTYGCCFAYFLKPNEAEWRIYASVDKIITGLDNDFSPSRPLAIIWTNTGKWLIGPFGTNFSEILMKIQTFWLNKVHLNMPSGKYRPFCLGFNVSTLQTLFSYKKTRAWLSLCL